MMPFFSSKFLPKQTPSRKVIKAGPDLEELVSENRSIKLKLGTQECCFENGEWTPANGANGSAHRANKKQQNKIQELEEENNILKLKYEILLNMLTQTTAESHIQQREIEKLRKITSR